MMTSGVSSSRRWRFQFSLRTLMLCVFAYVGLWALTANFGTVALAHHQAQEFGGQLTAQNNIAVQRILEGDLLPSEALQTTVYATRARVPAPFLILYECRLDNQITREGTYLWFFGRVWTLNKSAPQPPNFFSPDSTWVITE